MKLSHLLDPPSRRTTLLVLALLFLIMVVRIVATYGIFNATSDEGFHIAAGVEIYQARTYTALVEQPPLSRFPIGLLPYLAGARTLPGQHLVVQGRYVLESSGDYWKTLTLARIGNLIFVPVLLFYVYRWGAELYGRTAGIVAVCLITFCRVSWLTLVWQPWIWRSGVCT